MGAKYVEIVRGCADSYAGIENLLYTDAKGRMIFSRKVGNNTYLKRGTRGSIYLLLHQTPVLRWFPDNTIQLDTGGWYTITTKDRMNKWLPSRMNVFSHQGYWYVETERCSRRYWQIDHRNNVPYHDRMVVSIDTRQELTPRWPVEIYKKHNENVNRQIARWFRLFVRFIDDYNEHGNPAFDDDPFDDDDVDGYEKFDAILEHAITTTSVTKPLITCLYMEIGGWNPLRRLVYPEDKSAVTELFMPAEKLTLSTYDRAEIRKIFRNTLYRGPRTKAQIVRRGWY